MTRAEVFSIIDAEREYQDGLAGVSPGKKLAEEILLIEEYTARARTAWVNGRGHGLDGGDRGAALDLLRKSVAIAIRAMEHYGVPERVAK